jgi:hypothetical protein
MVKENELESTNNQLHDLTALHENNTVTKITEDGILIHLCYIKSCGGKLQYKMNFL